MTYGQLIVADFFALAPIMNMLFGAAVGVAVAWWRWRRPKSRQARERV